MNSVFQNKPLMRKHQIQLLAYSTFVSMKNAKRLLKLHLLTDSNCKYQGLITWVKWVSSDMMLSENGLLLTTSFLSFRRKQLFADFFKVGVLTSLQKQPLRGVSRKRCSENMQQIYRRTPMPKCSSVNLLHIFRTAFSKNTSGRLLLGSLFLLKFMKRY